MPWAQYLLEASAYRFSTFRGKQELPHKKCAHSLEGVIRALKCKVLLACILRGDIEDTRRGKVYQAEFRLS